MKLVKGIAFLGLLRRRRRDERAGLRRRRRGRAGPRAAREGGAAVSRDTGRSAYTDGTGMFVPREERVERGARIAGERADRADACVIGTGAGGAPVAKELAEGGMQRGDARGGRALHRRRLHRAPARDDHAALPRRRPDRPRWATRRSCCRSASTVGGTTLVNSGTCFRTPGAGARAVARALRPRGAHPRPSSSRTSAAWSASSTSSQVPPELAGNNARVVKRGADALGWSGDFIYRNAKGCVGSGVCAFGCPTTAKQHTGVTYVPRAWDAGATTYSGCRATRDRGRGRPRPRRGGPHRAAAAPCAWSATT